MPTTPVWGYGGNAKDAVTGDDLGFVQNVPGPSFEATRNVPVRVKWSTNITTGHMFAVDPTLHWADPNKMEMPLQWPTFPTGFDEAQKPVPFVTHLHGGEVPSESDGNPNAWFTWDEKRGPAYRSVEPTEDNAAVYEYPNTQEPTTLWYHDHALGITRINVMSGLAGFYMLREPENDVEAQLPSGKYEVPLAIQDRSFNQDGSFYFPNVGLDPMVHPYWQPEFFGNTIMVNGKVWPNMNVDRETYRLRLLNGSNARFYTISLIPDKGNPLPFTQIGTDGGFLKSAVSLQELSIAPGERADILVDFSKLKPGTKVLIKNDAKSPTPRGAPTDPRTTGQIMQFTVGEAEGVGMPTLPPELNPTLSGTYPNLPEPTKKRILTLTEVMGMLGPVEILLDGQKFSALTSEFPVNGTTEDWVIVNPTADTHPIHLHLVQFQLVSRQAFQVKKYYTDWTALNGAPPLNHPTVNVPNLTSYLLNKPIPPEPNEYGWKDTIQMKPGEVTTIRVRFASQNGEPFGFDPTSGPGYVWHCHILDHEDNEMMRPFTVINP